MNLRRFFVAAARWGAAAFLLGTGSPFAQAAPGDPTPVVWLKAEGLTGLANGAPVAAWKDSSGQGQDAAAPTDDQRPAYITGAIHGLPAVRFSAERKTLLALDRPVQDDFTLVCVYQSTQGLGQSPDWWQGAGLVSADAQWTQSDFGLALNAQGQVSGGTGNPDLSATSDVGYNDGKPHLVTLERVENTGTVTLYVDGLAADTMTAGTQSLTAPRRLVLGGQQTDQNFFTGDIAEVQVYDSALPDAARQSVENALKAKYGIVAVPRPVLTELPGTALERAKPLFPKPDPKPAIHGPRVVGASPGRPFLFLIPATGQGPLTYAATPLPTGIKLDPKTGILSGQMAAASSYDVQVRVSGPAGVDTRTLTLVCGEGRIALTPPMGWNSWNVYANQVTDAKIRAAADWLVKTGLAAHGYQYVNLDDSWEGPRDPQGVIVPNRRIGDVKALADYVHGKGLKFGLYSAPTPQTCSGFLGSQNHEPQDAATYSSWGVDYLKYDWCPGESKYISDPTEMKAAYGLMATALKRTSRDIVFAVSTYGKGSPWDWAGDIGGNTWSSNPSFLDTWEWLGKVGFNQRWYADHNKPGHWNDPGLLMVGKLGFGNLHRSYLTPAEQMTQISMWSLLSAPLMLSCELSQLDPNTFYPITTALLTNDEVIDIDQDPLGKAGYDVSGTSVEQVWARPLFDGTLAVGLFNRQDTPRRMKVRWTDLKLTEPQPVRDLWRRQDCGTIAEGFVAEVPAHGVVLLRIGQPQPVKKP